MHDGVDAAGTMRAVLARLTGPDDRPVLQIAAPPSACNAAPGERIAVGGATAIVLSALSAGSSAPLRP